MRRLPVAARLLFVAAALPCASAPASAQTIMPIKWAGNVGCPKPYDTLGVFTRYGSTCAEVALQLQEIYLACAPSGMFS